MRVATRGTDQHPPFLAPASLAPGILVLALTAGCVGGVRVLDGPPPGPPGMPSARFASAQPDLTFFARPPRPPRVRLEHLDRGYVHDVWRFTMPSAGRNGQPGREVRGVLHLARAERPLPLAVVLPIWGASDYPSTTTARHLVRGRWAGDLHVLRLEAEARIFPWDDLAAAQGERQVDEWMASSRERFRSAVVDLRSIVDWAEGRDEVDGRRVGVVGFSIGALVGAVALGVEPRLAAGVLVMGGARVADTFATCYRSAGRARQVVLETLGWDLEELRAVVRRELGEVEPLRVARFADPRGILLIDAEDDECFPEHGRDELWEALGRPRRATLAWGHRSSFFSMTFLGFHRTTHRIVRFLGRRLVGDLAPDPGPRTGPFTTAAPARRR